MGYGDCYWGLYRGYYRDPFPHSLRSTRQLKSAGLGLGFGTEDIGVVVKIVVHFSGTLNIRCRIIIRDPKRDPNFDNYP